MGRLPVLLQRCSNDKEQAVIETTRETVIGLLDREPISVELEKVVDEVERLTHRQQTGPMSPAVLALVVMLHQRGVFRDEPKPTAETIPRSPNKPIRWSTVPAKTPVMAVRFGEAVKGTFMGALGGKDRGKLRIKIDGDKAAFREIPAGYVTIIRK